MSESAPSSVAQLGGEGQDRAGNSRCRRAGPSSCRVNQNRYRPDHGSIRSKTIQPGVVNHPRPRLLPVPVVSFDVSRVS